MKINKKTIDYIGQIIYVGIDVHKRSWKITIRIGGITIETFTMNADPKGLVRYLRKNYPNGKYKTVYEAGFCGYWIDRLLKAEGIDNIVVNPADVPSSSRDKIYKTDSIDSQKLARELESGNLTGIYIPNPEQEALRALSRLRIQFTKDQTRIKNRIKSLLNFTGIKFPENYELRHWSKKFIEYISEIKFNNPILKTVMNKLIENLLQTRKQLAEILKELRNCVKENEELKEVIRRLETVPGIAFITAITIYTEIMEIRRFNGLDRLSAYVGLVPASHSSGEKEKVLGISKRQNSILREMLIESAWVSVRKDPAMTMKFAMLTRRMKKQEAIIRIAKKLLSRISHVWKYQKEYVHAVVA